MSDYRQQEENEQQRYEEEIVNVFETLSKIDVSKWVQQKNGLTYLSWAHALAVLMKHFPTATWWIERFDGLPYCKTETGYFVEVGVNINGIVRSCMLPVLDYRNQTIPKPNAFQINTSCQRALAKCLALHGLGLHVYAGEDLPFAFDESTQQAIDVGCDAGAVDRAAELVIEAIRKDDKQTVVDVMESLSKEEQTAIWVAKTKGGYFSTEEKEYIRKAKFEVYQQREQQNGV